MNDRINQVLAQMTALEADLVAAVHEQKSRTVFEIQGKRVRFVASVELLSHLRHHQGKKAVSTHAHYNRFLDYGDAVDYHERLDQFRVSLGKLK